MGDTLVHSASGLLWLMGRWGCGDRGSDIHQIPRLAHAAERTGTEPAALRMDVSQLNLGIAHQPVAIFGLDHARARISAWVDDYNQPRPHSALGYIPPAAHAANLITAAQSRAKAAEALIVPG